MKNNYNKGIEYFESGCYKKALECFKGIKEDSDYSSAAQCYMISCFINLKEYRDALVVIDVCLKKYPDVKFLWYDKVTSHAMLNEDDKAFKALQKLESLIDENDPNELVNIARFFNILDDFDKSSEYCNKALAIDENFKEALHEKAIVGIGMDDCNIINDVADKLLEICGDDLSDILHIFLLKIFSKHYNDAYDLIDEHSERFVSQDTVELFSAILYKRICEDLNVDIFTVSNIKLVYDDALRILFDYMESGKDSGIIDGVKYHIV